MLQASLLPERWASMSQYRRPCQGTPFVHPATERTPQMYYDQFGYCDPTMVQPTGTVTQIVEKTPAWVYYVVIGGVAYLAWKYRAKLKKWI